MRVTPDFVVLFSADAEWRIVQEYYSKTRRYTSPYGDWFVKKVGVNSFIDKPVIFFQGGWGKVAAAGSTQYVINRWHPKLIINLGTCGGFEGDIDRGEIILVEETIIYDIYEQMGDPDEHIKHYATQIDTSWLDQELPLKVICTLLVSGDRDLFCEEIPMLKSKYEAIAGDWESGAIAWVAAKNKTHCLILRGVTDLVGENSGEAYNGKVSYYYENTGVIMRQLIESLPQWLTMYIKHFRKPDLKQQKT